MPDVPSLTVLMVEPHADTADMYAEMFRHHGINVMTVSNAASALAAVAYADVVVTTLRMPGDADGAELIARLRGDARTKNIPIAVVSACVSPADRQRAHDAGCDRFLPKPCLPNVLVNEVRRLALRSNQRHAPRRSLTSEATRARHAR